MPTEKNFRHGHRERVRARFLREGLSAFADYEVLELLLFYAIPRRDTKEQAHALDDTLGSLYHTLTASDEELCRVPGIGAHTATFLHSILPFLEYVATEEPRDEMCHDKKTLAKRIYPHLKREGKPSSLVAFLSNSDEIICIQQLENEKSASSITMEKLISWSYAYRASSIVIVDYKSSGIPFPDAVSLQWVHRLRDELSTIGIHVRDYLLFTDTQYSSLLFMDHVLRSPSPFFIDADAVKPPPFLVDSADRLVDILRFVTKEEKARAFAERLLKKYRTIANLLALPYETLLEENAEDSTEVLYLKILLEVRSRAWLSRARAERKIYTSASELGVLFSNLLGLHSEENMALAMFDEKMQLIDIVFCSKGSVNTTSFVTRKLMEIACAHHAAYVALVHNHPNGSPVFSMADGGTTAELARSFHQIKVKVVDHFVVTTNGYACASRCGAGNYSDMPKSFFD